MQDNRWSFTWTPTRTPCKLPPIAEELVRSFCLDEFDVKKDFVYRNKRYTVELRPGEFQGCRPFIIATCCDTGVEISVQSHYVELPDALICKVSFAKRSANNANRGKKNKKDDSETSSGSSMETD